MTEDARELRVLDVNDSQPDQWTVRLGCASQRVCEMIEDAWTPRKTLAPTRLELIRYPR